ncbi:hypothetical protein AAEX37_01569 [Oligella sp. MSHR50489EDL]|uniref:uracil-DNA glycosylase family protein n=1 Tax=Oligella sp. MSHR50489EDL TaxID=3139409 RepID=UPI003D81ADBE
MIADSLNLIQKQMLTELGIDYLWGRSLAPDLQKVLDAANASGLSEPAGTEDLSADAVQLSASDAEVTTPEASTPATPESAQAAAEAVRKMLQRAKHRLPESSQKIPTEGSIPSQSVASLSVSMSAPATQQTQAGVAAAGTAYSLHELSWQALLAYAAECYGGELSEQTRAALFTTQAVNPAADWLFIEQLPNEATHRPEHSVLAETEKLFGQMLLALALQPQAVQRLPLLMYSAERERGANKNLSSHLSPIMMEQIKRIRPKCIVAFGDAAAALLKVESGLLALRRQALLFEHPDIGSIPVVATFSPQYLLHHSSEKAQAWQDLKRARRIIHSHA